MKKQETNFAVALVIYSIIMVVAIYLILVWASGRDEKLMIATELYEECVAQEYNTTPSAWYAEHREYPECDIQSNINN